jgi:hypothetical protein
MSDYNLTLFEACELLNRSKKSISRYIRRGLLHPQQIKSQQGTLEYRFSEEDLEAFKQRQSERRQDRQDTQDRTEEIIYTPLTEEKEENILDKAQTEETGQPTPDQTGQDNKIINLLEETTGILKEQLNKKDEQIKDLGGKIDQLIERDRETNILLKGLQEKILMLEKPKKKDKQDKKEKETVDIEKREKRGFFNKLFN